MPKTRRFCKGAVRVCLRAQAITYAAYLAYPANGALPVGEEARRRTAAEEGPQSIRERVTYLAEIP